MEQTKNKLNNIETFRGLACILIVAHHQMGLHVDSDHFLRHLDRSLSYLRMPLFTFIAGYVYALRPVRSEEVKEFIRKKTRRLLVPLLVVGTLFAVLQSLTPGTNNSVDLWTIHIKPVGHFWYLQALFLILMFTIPWELAGFLSQKMKFLFLMTLVLVAHLYLEPTKLFAIYHALSILPYFFLGVAACRFPEKFFRPGIMAVLVFIFAISFLCTQAGLLGWVEKVEKVSWMGVFVGATGSLCLFSLRWEVKFLSLLGRYSYPIYMFHVFGTGASRIFLQKLGFHSKIVLFTSCTLTGILLPILVTLLAQKTPFTRFFLLGENWNSSASRKNVVDKSGNEKKLLDK